MLPIKVLMLFAAIPVVWVVTLVFHNAWATADGPDCWKVSGIAVRDTLNVRSAPNARARVLGAIPPDRHPLKNLNEDPKSDMDPPKYPGWCKVQYRDLVGWVACRFLEMNDECL